MPSRLLSFVPHAIDVHYDIDEYLDRIIPPSQLHRLPRPISRFLGYRSNPKPDVGNILIALWAIVGTFLGLVTVAAVFKYAPNIRHYNPPVLFASFGATAILEYNAIHSPLAQPRNAVVGHGLAAVLGVAVGKFFRLNVGFESLRWLAGPLACGIASAIMTLTNTVHPPGGATAVLAIVDPTVGALGWLFVPLILLGSVLMILVALVVDNIQRRYPIYWWTPKDVGQNRKNPTMDVESTNGSNPNTLTGSVNWSGHSGFGQVIIVSPEGLALPHEFHLEGHEMQVLRSLIARLQSPEIEDTVTAEEVNLELQHQLRHQSKSPDSGEKALTDKR